MDERITHFIQSITAQLEGLPESEIRKVVSFYEEYFNEAVEAGQDPEQLINSLGTPEKIAVMLRTEISLLKAESNPSLGNFSKVLRNSFRYVTTPFMVFLLAMVVLLSGGMVAALFGGVLTAVIGGIAVSIGLIIEGVRIPGKFLLEIIGTFGISFFGSGICLLLAFCLYRGARLLIQLTTKLIRFIIKLSGKTLPEPAPKNVPRAKSHTFVYILSGLTLVGGILAGVSGLAWKYLVIFNEMRAQATLKKVVAQYDPRGIEKLSIVTAHSKIKMTRNSVDKIVITYEQPDWLDYEVKSEGSMLSFYENSNGRLPLFQLVAFHVSFTELSISLPKGFEPELITLESTGGTIEISGLVENASRGARITAKTFTGEINFDSNRISNNYSLKANTSNGQILVNGVGAGQRVSEGMEYYQITGAAKDPVQATVELKSENGNISID